MQIMIQGPNGPTKARRPTPEVLRKLHDNTDVMKAWKLASKGYTISQRDVWGQLSPEFLRLANRYGYTWLPTIMQPSVEIAPGLGAFGMLTAYDPDNPPLGSILVKQSLATVVDDALVMLPTPRPFRFDRPDTRHPEIESYLSDGPRDKFKDGAIWTENGKSFVRKTKWAMFTRYGVWEAQL